MHREGEAGRDSPDPLKRQFPRKFKNAVAKGIQTLLLCMAVGVLIQNFVLQRQNKNLKDMQSKMIPIEQMSRAVNSQIAAGQQILGVSGATLNGQFRDMKLRANSSPGSVIMTFSPVCIHCLHNQQGWGLLAGKLKSLGWQVIWVSRDAQDLTLEYCKAHDIDPSDVIADPTHRTYDQLALAVVPFTVVVDSTGTVKQVWTGELGQSWHSVFAYFQLSEPASLNTVQNAKN
jgi:peroxiredoxin